MAMLAAPRRKQKVINLRAKNSEWSNDTNKFGQRMLEKMGWSSGKGLGANEDGMVEHVIARYKNDEKGLGYEDKNDQWTKHEDDFNSLLANLSNGDNSEEKLHSGISLEDKSKKSKARVHYHKFTRGKDLTKYSEKDLANIFGKKSFKSDSKFEELKDDNKNTEQVFTEKGSMEDYFKSKLAAISSVNKNSDYQYGKEEVDYNFQGFSGTGKQGFMSEVHDDAEVQGFSFTKNSSKENDDDINNINDENSTKKKKKKYKKRYVEQTENDEIECQLISNEISSNSPSEIITEDVEPVKKKKCKKYKQENEISKDIEKPKKKKFKIENLTTTKPIAETVDEDYHVPKKKKKRKNKDIES